MGRLRSSQMHLRSGPVCGLQMRMENSKAMNTAMIRSTGNIRHMAMATNDSGAGLGGLVSTT